MRFTREPAVIIAIIVATITLLAAYIPKLWGVDHLVQALLIAVWTAVTAWKVRPIAPAVITGVIAAVVDLAARIGWHANTVQLSAINALAVLIFAGLLTRPQVSPVADSLAEHAQGRVSQATVGRA